MLDKPRDRKPKIGTQLWVQAFHEHLDHCKRCADNPFDLCIVGSSLEHDWMAQHHILDFRNWLIEKLWTAAAVSKNLQEAYDREHAWLNNAATEANCDLNEVAGAIMQLKASVEQLCGDLKAIQQDYTNEKELAEKLEKALLKFGHHLPGCNAADANHICGCGWNAAQEIAALRETK